MISREALPDGSIRLRDDTCSFLYTRPRPGVLLTTISGYDAGQFGSAPLDELTAELARVQPIRLFFDARQVFGLTTGVREAWTAWFHANQHRIAEVHILVGSSFIHTVISVTKLFSRTGDLLRIYSDEHSFEEAMGSSLEQR